MIRVIIADDHDLIRDGFRRLIDYEPQLTWVGEARTAEELFRVLEVTACDVLLLDLSLPDKNGLDILKDLKVYQSSCRVLILSMHPEERYAQRALQNGAYGYITKGRDTDELIKAVKMVARGEKYLGSEFTQQLTLEKSNSETPHRLLTDREYQVFMLIGDGKRVYDIAEHLHMSVNTVYTHRRKLMEKMHLFSNTELVHYAMENHLIE
jgi:two-component system, NarL family, invasion response regulator UvrY